MPMKIHGYVAFAILCRNENIEKAIGSFSNKVS